LYSKVKLLTLALILGVFIVAAFACSQSDVNRIVSPDRGSDAAIDRGIIVTEDAKLASIESLRIEDRVLSHEISIKFVDGITDEQRDSILNEYHLSVMKVITELGFYRLKMAGGESLVNLLDDLWDEENIEVAEPIFRTYAKQLRVEPNDPRLSEQAYLEQINAPEAWFIEPGSDLAVIPQQSDVVIAVLDTGIDMNHPDIMISTGQFDGVKILDGWNFVDGNRDVMDGHGHGTLVTGILGALTHNGQGIAGTAWNPRILPVKVLDNDGVADSFTSAEGIMFALGRFNDLRGEDQNFTFPLQTIFADPFNAKMVINMSYGYTVPNTIGQSQAEYSAISECMETVHVLCVAAAGDDGTSIDDGIESIYPANNRYVVKVGAVDYANNSLSTTNIPSLTESIETQPFVVAPGYNILSTYPTEFSEGYAVGNGTSFAAAQVSGLVGLIWSQFPFLRPDEVVDILKDSSNFDIVGVAGIDDQTGWGLIDCVEALQRSYHPKPITEPVLIKAFTNPILHGDIIFVVKSRYRLMDPVETPIYFDYSVDPPIEMFINEGRAVSYLVGYDTDNDGEIDQEITIQLTSGGLPMYFPNNLCMVQFTDDLYIGRVHLDQDTAPQKGTLMIQFTGVPMDFRQNPEVPMTVTGETTIEITGFHHS